MERITISLEKDLLNQVKAVAGSRGVSKFMAAAARRELGRAELYAWFDEMDAKYGAPSPELVAEVDREMRKAFGMPPPPKKRSRRRRSRR